MNSFTVTAIGNLARDPELGAKGDTMYTRFCLVGNDYGGRDEQGALRHYVTTLWFVAFGSIGEAIARNARKGDQLVIHAQIRANNWTDKEGELQYDYSFIVQGFKFAAPGKVKREELEAARHAKAVQHLEHEDLSGQLDLQQPPSEDFPPTNGFDEHEHLSGTPTLGFPLS